MLGRRVWPHGVCVDISPLGLGVGEEEAKAEVFRSGGNGLSCRSAVLVFVDLSHGVLGKPMLFWRFLTPPFCSNNLHDLLSARFS